MTPADYNRQLSKAQNALKGYVNNVFPRRAGTLSILFINGNFQMEGWRGDSLVKWKPVQRKGKILTKTGRLRRGTFFTVQPGVAHIQNDVKYARVHNSGFYGTVHVRAHTRKKFKVGHIETGRLTSGGKHQIKTVHKVSSEINVKAHDRKMNIPQRQFMPTNMGESQTLANAIKREINRELKAIFK